jgi:hypothetical protein
VDLHRRDAHLDDFLANDDVGRRDGCGREAEIGDGGQQPAAVVLGGSDEDVEVARKAWSAVERQRMRPDDDVLDVTRAQQRAELVEVWRQVNVLSPQELHGTHSNGANMLTLVRR